MSKVVLFVLLAFFIAGASYADDKETAWNDNFISNSINDAFSKVNKVVSGDEPIFSKDAKGVDNLLTQGHLDDRNALGMRKPDVTAPLGETSNPDEPL
jgi:hypothetical protein